MLGLVFPRRALPQHHTGMLLVGLHDSAEALVPHLARGRSSGAAPGLTAAARHAAAGRLSRAAALHARPARSSGGRGSNPVARAIVASGGRGRSGGWHGRTILLALHPRAHRALPELQEALRDDPHVRFAEPVPVRHLFVAHPDGTDGADILPLVRLWHLDSIGWTAARAAGALTGGRAVRVGVIDSGVDPDHPCLRGRVVEYVHSYPAAGARTSRRDMVGHGTHVCGIIAGRAATSARLHGMTASRLHVWKIFADDPPFDQQAKGFVYFADPVMYRQALLECGERGMDVVNVSFGGPSRLDALETLAYQRMLDQGTVIVAAMGNARQLGSPVLWPAAFSGVVAVGATDQHDQVAPFSSAGRHIALTAPGVEIWSSLPRGPGQVGFAARSGPGGRVRPGAAVSRNQTFDGWPGTSMAAPQVAAAAALLRAKHPALPVAEVRRRLMESADAVPAMKGARWTRDYGAGRLNVRRLLER